MSSLGRDHREGEAAVAARSRSRPFTGRSSQGRGSTGCQRRERGSETTLRRTEHLMQRFPMSPLLRTGTLLETLSNQRNSQEGGGHSTEPSTKPNELFGTRAPALLPTEMGAPLRSRRAEIRDPARSTRPLGNAPDEPSSMRRTETSVGLMGSGRGRRHPHRRARSASPCCVSRGPRAYRVRVPIVLTRRRTWRRQSSRSQQSIGIPTDTPGDSASASGRSVRWRAIFAHNRRSPSVGGCQPHSSPRQT